MNWKDRPGSARAVLRFHGQPGFHGPWSGRTARRPDGPDGRRRTAPFAGLLTGDPALPSVARPLGAGGPGVLVDSAARLLSSRNRRGTIEERRSTHPCRLSPLSSLPSVATRKARVSPSTR